MEISAVTDGKDVIEELQERITGRFACEEIYREDEELIEKPKLMITPKRAALV